MENVFALRHLHGSHLYCKILRLECTRARAHVVYSPRAPLLLLSLSGSLLLGEGDGDQENGTSIGLEEGNRLLLIMFLGGDEMTVLLLLFVGIIEVVAIIDVVAAAAPLDAADCEGTPMRPLMSELFPDHERFNPLSPDVAMLPAVSAS